MRRSQRLQPVLDLARQKSRQGMQAVAYMQQRLEEEQERLKQLQLCKRENININKNDNKQIFTAHSLRGLREFSANVELAVQQQTRQVETVQEQLRQVRAQWRQLDARSQSLEKTQQRFQQEEMRQLDRIEQREQEEFARQQSLASSGASRRNAP